MTFCSSAKGYCCDLGRLNAPDSPSAAVLSRFSGRSTYVPGSSTSLKWPSASVNRLFTVCPPSSRTVILAWYGWSSQPSPERLTGQVGPIKTWPSIPLSAGTTAGESERSLAGVTGAQATRAIRVIVTRKAKFRTRIGSSPSINKRLFVNYETYLPAE